MAEPQVATPDSPGPPPSAGDSVQSALGLKEITSKMADNQREKIAAEDKIYDKLNTTIDQSLPKIEQLSKTAGVEAEKLKPWNADEEAAKRRTDPIEAFGSFGSVFGILASAFTHAPMENALNASAAAMNAIKENDSKAYDRAHKGWEDNMKLVMDRYKIQHDAYQDATSFLSTNMQAANTKLSVLAARFGDKQVQLLLDAGMNGDVEKLLQGRQKLAMEIAEAQPKIIAENAKISRLFALGYDTKNPTSEKSQEALKTFQEEQADLKRQEHTYGTPSLGKEDANEVASRTAQYEAQGMSHEQAFDKARQEVAAAGKKGGTTGGNTNLTGDRQRAADVAAFRKELSEAKNDDGSPQYTREEIAEKAANYEKHLKTVAAAPSGNKADDIKSIENKITVAEHTIDQIDDMLLKHKAITGIGGKITRTGEAVGNIIGSNKTDRAQFRRWVLELQETMPSIINGRNGRPISSEAAKIEGIVAGLAAGDTNANTLRAYDELRPLLKTLKKQLQERRGVEGGPDAPAPSKNAPSWESYPEAK